MSPKFHPMLNSIWDNDASGYDAIRSSWLSHRKTLYLLKFLRDANPGDMVLEVGSGTGATLIYLAAMRPDLYFIGVEPNDTYVKYSCNKAQNSNITNIKFINCSAEELVLNKQKLDPVNFVISTDVLHHVVSQKETVEAISKISKIGAKWSIIEPSWLNPYIAYFQATTEGERNFRPQRFLKLAAYCWSHTSTQYINIIPSAINNPSKALKKFERVFEGIPGLSGTISMELKNRGFASNINS